MKKVFLSSILMFILFGNLFAQTDPARDEQNLIFQYINKAQIPSGYLDEYGPQVVDKNWLNGVLADSNRIYNLELFRYLYNDIENSRLYTSAPAMTTLESVNTAISQVSTASSTPLVFLTGQYSILREDAIQQNLFTYSNNQIYDVQGRIQSPYILKNIFAATPIKQTAPATNTLSLTYNPALRYSNNNKIISQVWVDFLDGAGYRSVAANGSVSKTYTDASGYKRFAVKVLYTNNTYNYCYSGQYVTVSNIAARYTPFTKFEIANPTGVFAPVPGQHLGGKAYVRYSSKRHGTSLQEKMIKPFIIVEGYDIHDVAPKLKEKNYDANDLLKEWNELAQIDNYDFNKALDDTAGYDLVFVEYNTMDDIRANARFLQTVIQWINSQKIAGSSEQNVVMGISLGGLLARYTLAKMTKDPTLGPASTQTRLLLTQDSPHQGANVPLGFQHFLYDLGEAKVVRSLKNVSDELQEFYKLNLQPSTQQLLIARVTDANGGVAYNTFLAGEYRTMITFTSSNPQPSYQFKAITQGSRCSKYVIQPGSLLAYKDGNIATANFLWFAFRSKYKLTIQINALPAYGTSAQISYVKMQRNIRLFFGVIGTGWKTTYEPPRRYSPSNIIPWDCVPGGTQSASGRAGGSFSDYSVTPDPKSTSHTYFGNVWRSFVFPYFNVRSYLDIPFQQDIFTFVPLNSALDIQNTTLNTFNQSYIFPVNGVSGSTSVKYVAQEGFTGTVNGTQAPLTNQLHTTFTKRNSQWIISQMENRTFDDCAAACDNLLKITGNESVCPTSTFSVNRPPGSSVVWEVSPLTIATVNSSTGVVTRVSNGSATLTAKVISCGYTVPVSKTVQVGGPPVVNISYSQSGACNGSYQTWYLNATSPNAITSWQWTVNNPSSGSWNINSPNSPNTYVSVSGGGGISVTATSSCGTTKTGVTIYSNCGFGITASPNPTTDNVTIAVEQPKDGSKKKAMMYQIKVADQFSTVKKQYKYSSGTSNTTISLSGLMNGMYTILAFDGTSWSSVKVIKQ